MDGASGTSSDPLEDGVKRSVPLERQNGIVQAASMLRGIES